MEYERFTEGAQKALAIAQEEAKKLGHNYVGTEHVLLGLAKAEEGVTAKVFPRNGFRIWSIGWWARGTGYLPRRLTIPPAPSGCYR